MEPRDMVRSQLALAHRLLDQVLADVSEQAMRAKPGGTINPIGSIWAHIVYTEDVLVNKRVLERPTVASSGGWPARTGIAEPEAPAQPDDGGDWTNNLNVAEFRDYAKAVFAATDEGVANASDEVLNREIDMGPMGKQPAFALISGIALYHVGEHTGEIAALKGVSGSKGLPF